MNDIVVVGSGFENSDNAASCVAAVEKPPSFVPRRVNGRWNAG